MRRFGRSGDLRQLDDALRAADLHPALVHEGAKLAIVNLMKDYYPDEPPAEAYAPVADLIAFCALGPAGFAHANGPERTTAVEGRMGAAIAAGDSPDAQLVLLALHARLAHPDVVERYDLRAE